MIRKYVLPLLAIAGVALAAWTAMMGARPVPAAPPVAEPSHAPFASCLAGAGIVEASSENIAASTPVPGLIVEVMAKPGAKVRTGEPLFRLDDRDLRAELDLLKAGAWAPDLAVAKAEITSAESQVHATEVALERLVILAPVDATILQVNVRPGEYARTGDALVLLGSLEVLHVRIDIDENDAWRFKAGAAAIGSVRGNSQLTAKLEFVRIEPFVIPKKSLTGASQERVDTRVMQVIYRFNHDTLPLYVGQQMDVVIEAPPISGGK